MGGGGGEGGRGGRGGHGASPFLEFCTRYFFRKINVVQLSIFVPPEHTILG